MSGGGGRAVRIPRARSEAPESAGMPAGLGASVERRENRGGLQRVQRLALLYVVGILIGYAAIVGYARASTASTSGGQSDLLLLGYFALAFAIAGAVLALSSAPRAIELRATGTRVIGFLGVTRAFPPLGDFSVRVLKEHPANFLSSRPTETVELGTRTMRRTYLLEEGLLPSSPPRGS